MNPLERIAEARLQEAADAGAFDDLVLAGRPLELEDLSRVPEELRAAYSILKSSGHLPEELELRQSMLRIQDLLAACDDERRAGELRERWTAQSLRLELLMERRRGRVPEAYRAALRRRLG